MRMTADEIRFLEKKCAIREIKGLCSAKSSTVLKDIKVVERAAKGRASDEELRWLRKFCAKHDHQEQFLLVVGETAYDHVLFEYAGPGALG